MTRRLLLRLLYTLITLGLLLPILALVYLSLVRQWAFPQLLGANFSAHHWAVAVQGTSGLWESVLTSLGISGAVACMATAGGFVISRYVLYHRHGRRLLAVAYYPYLIAPVVMGVMLQFYFIQMGITGTVWGVVLAQLLFVFPYAVLFFAGFWTAHTRAIEGQAITLGARRSQVLFSVLLPMAREWLYICCFQCFMISWFEYGMTQYVGIGKVATLTVRTMQYIREANPHVAAVAACLMVLPPVALLFLNRRLLLRDAQSHD